MSKVEKIIKNYYAILHEGFSTGSIDLKSLPFDEEVTFSTPNFAISGKQEVYALYTESVKTIQRIELKEIFVSDSTACAVVEYTLYHDPAPLLAAEWFHFKGEGIAKLDAIFDTAAWEKVSQR